MVSFLFRFRFSAIPINYLFYFLKNGYDVFLLESESRFYYKFNDIWHFMVLIRFTFTVLYKFPLTDLYEIDILFYYLIVHPLVHISQNWKCLMFYLLIPLLVSVLFKALWRTVVSKAHFRCFQHWYNLLFWFTYSLKF